MPTCEYCSNSLSNNQSLKRHHLTCKKKNKYIPEIQLQVERDQYEQQIQNLKYQYEQQIQTQQLQYEQQLQTQQLQIEKLESQIEKLESQIEKLESQIEKLENQIFEIAKQPKQNTINNNMQTTNTNNNQRIMNITNQLIPMNLSKDDLRQLVTKYYTTDTFLGGPESIAQMTVDHILVDQESGKFRVVCTDTARGIFYFQDADNNLIRDIGMQKIQEKLIAPLNEATRLEYERLEKKKQMNPHRLMNLYGDNLSCISNNELPNRVKKSIQLPIVNSNTNVINQDQEQEQEQEQSD
jgi:hypothetical protein